jgi:Xaa-Pro aminopeptidase
MDNFAQRRERVARQVAELDLHGFLVTNPINVSYLTNFSGDSSYLLVGRDRVLLISDGRYEVQLREECPGLPFHIRPPSKKVLQATAEEMGKLAWGRVGFESGHLTVAEHVKLQETLKTVQWKACEDAVERLRLRKDATEIAAIRRAIRIAERAFKRWQSSLRGTDVEKQLGDRMEMFIRDEGGKCSSFPPIVGVGARSALPHAPLSAIPLDAGDFVLVDWGANEGFYMSDLTRVLATRKISPKLAQVHDAVCKAQARAMAKIRPGVKAHEIDAEARAALSESGFGAFFSHSLGHGFGLEIHEAPFLRPNSDIVLEAGMVVTVEPGVYLADWGGVRIEDDVLVTPDGCEVLTSLSREMDFQYQN